MQGGHLGAADAAGCLGAGAVAGQLLVVVRGVALTERAPVDSFSLQLAGTHGRGGDAVSRLASGPRVAAHAANIHVKRGRCTSDSSSSSSDSEDEVISKPLRKRVKRTVATQGGTAPREAAVDDVARTPPAACATQPAPVCICICSTGRWSESMPAQIEQHRDREIAAATAAAAAKIAAIAKVKAATVTLPAAAAPISAPVPTADQRESALVDKALGALGFSSLHELRDAALTEQDLKVCAAHRDCRPQVQPPIRPPCAHARFPTQANSSVERLPTLVARR